MTGTQAPTQEAQFAAALGVSADELAVVGETFASLLARIGVNGKLIFDRLSEGRTLASALSAPPGAADVLYARAHSWFSIGRTDKAEFLFRALCAIAGDIADHWVGYGICLKIGGRLAQAEQAFTVAVRQRPDWAIPHLHLVEIFLRGGDDLRARASLASFDERKDRATPEFALREADRFRTALALRIEAAQSLESDARLAG